MYICSHKSAFQPPKIHYYEKTFIYSRSGGTDGRMRKGTCNYPPPAVEEAVTTEIPQRNVENAVYNELTDSWMIPQADPYTLENFQKAYDNLASGKSLQTLTRVETEELFEPGVKLKPTHYALRIYPRNEDEQWRVEMMEDISVAYAPFNYSSLTAEEVERVLQTRSEISSPFEVSPYTVTYKDYVATDGGSIGPRTFQLPILYAVWPLEKSLPDDLEYVIDYEVFLPYNASLPTRSAEALNVLESKAVVEALGYMAIIPASTDLTRALPPERETYANFSGQLLAYDNTIGRNVPVASLGLRASLGSKMSNVGVTDSNGRFTIRFAASNMPRIDVNHYGSITVSLNVNYADHAVTASPKWRITNENSTNLASVSMNAVVSDMGVPATILPVSSKNAMQRAANYFFNTQTYFPKPYLSDWIRIIANPNPNSTPDGNYTGGVFYFPNSGSSNNSNTFIEIWNNSTPDADVVGSMLHELGHFAHYWNNNSRYRNTLRFIKEAFSSYSGWYLTHEYYRSLGRPIYSDEDITSHGLYDGQSQQMWDKTSSRIYTPLLVDLTDNYNQRAYYGYFNPADFPNDNLKDVPASVIWNIIINSQDWTQFKTKLQSYSGTGTGKYYTLADYNAWITTFEDWLVTYKEYLTLY